MKVGDRPFCSLKIPLLGVWARAGDVMLSFGTHCSGQLSGAANGSCAVPYCVALLDEIVAQTGFAIRLETSWTTTSEPPTRRLVCSTSEAILWHGKADHKAFRFPVSRDISTQLAGGGTNKKIAESRVDNRRSDRRSAKLRPDDDDSSSPVRAVNVDLAGRSGKCAILYRVWRELVQQQR